MSTLTIILEDHSQSTTFDYLIANLVYLKQAIVCLELSKVGMDDEITPFLLPEVEKFIKTMPQQIYPGTINVFSLLVDLQHPLLYPIDGLWGGDSDFSAFLLSIAQMMDCLDEFISRVGWLRDEYMAKRLLKLLLRNPEKNIVTILGQAHYGVIYHLLYLLPENLLRMPIRLINLVTSRIGEVKDRYYLDFYYEEMPVDEVNYSLIEPLPALNSPIKTRLFSLAALTKFKQEYEQRNLRYQIIRKKLEELVNGARQLTGSNFCVDELSANEVRAVGVLFKRLIRNFIQTTALPANGELLGRELCSIPWGGLTSQVTKGFPPEFMIRHYPLSFVTRHYDPAQEWFDTSTRRRVPLPKDCMVLRDKMKV